MSTFFTEEQQAFRSVVRDFAARQIAPHASDWDRDHMFPTDTVRAMGELGLFGLVFPEEYGGGSADFTTLCIAIEEIGRADQSMGITLEAGVALGAKPIFDYGTESQKQQYLPDLVTGQALAGFALTEPGGVSDAQATQTRADIDHSGGPRGVGDQRHQDIHHQLGHRHHQPRHRHRQNRRRHLSDHRPRWNTRSCGGTGLPQDGVACLRYPRPGVR